MLHTHSTDPRSCGCLNALDVLGIQTHDTALYRVADASGKRARELCGTHRESEHASIAKTMGKIYQASQANAMPPVFIDAQKDV